MQLEIGMSKKAILDMFGKPNYRNLNDNAEEWEYKKDNYEGFDFLKISFGSDDKVSEFNSYFIPKNRSSDQ